MAEVWIPALLLDLTGGEQRVPVAAASVRELVNALEERYPGMKARLLEGDRLRPGLRLVVDGEVSYAGLRQKLTETSEVHFMPALSGGSDGRV